MLVLNFAGNTGRDAEYKTTQGGAELCRFTVAAETGFGENKVTTWVDVTKWGKGSEGLARILRKGSKVAVSGEMSLREHNGKTYVQCRADHIGILSTPDGGQRRQSDNGGTASRDRTEQSGSYADDLDDSIPF